MENRTVQKETASKRNTNRAQVQRLWPELAQRLGQGETVSYLYDDLSERGEIAMSMRTFMRWVARFKEGPELPSPPVESMSQRRVRAMRERSSASKPDIRSNKNTRKPGEPFIGSIGITHEPFLPNPNPNLKKLIGEE